MKSYIFKKDFEHRYNNAFQQYVIHAYFGDDILRAEDLLEQENDENED